KMWCLTRNRRGATVRRREPERTCVVCRQRRRKPDLLRVGRGPGLPLAVMPSGRGGGRGAYVCRRRQCWASPHRNPRLASALKYLITDEEAAALDEWGAARVAATGAADAADAALSRAAANTGASNAE
ncbi:MAG: YlxR family protein, partial [Anaerolineae bacterium]